MSNEKEVIVLIRELTGMQRNRHDPIKSYIRTFAMSCANCSDPGVSATKVGAAKGMGSMTPSVISIRNGAAVASGANNKAIRTKSVRNMSVSSVIGVKCNFNFAPLVIFVSWQTIAGFLT